MILVMALASCGTLRTSCRWCWPLRGARNAAHPEGPISRTCNGEVLADALEVQATGGVVLERDRRTDGVSPDSDQRTAAMLTPGVIRNHWPGSTAQLRRRPLQPRRTHQRCMLLPAGCAGDRRSDTGAVSTASTKHFFDDLAAVDGDQFLATISLIVETVLVNPQGMQDRSV